MRFAICLSATVLVACSAAALAQPASTPAGTPTASPAPTPAAPTPAAPTPAATAAPTPAAAPAAFQLNETTWTFTDKKGTKVKESIDSKGNYIANSVDGKHLDHGTSVMKSDKACFTSAMTKEGEVCWTTKAVAIGQSMDSVSSKGEKLTVTRVGYVPLTMPK